MAWRVADALIVLRQQIDTLAPLRNKKSDGTIGDAAHASRKSDHNPWIVLGKMRVVSAMDLTHDPVQGADMAKISEALRQSHDSRIKYVIFNRRIFYGLGGTKPAWGWTHYSGKNPHNKHMHISVRAVPSAFDSKDLWLLNLEGLSPTEEVSAPLVLRKTLRLGASNDDVVALQTLLNSFGAKLDVDGKFGKKTREKVEEFQRSHGLVDDGVVGPYTWEKLEKEK